VSSIPAVLQAVYLHQRHAFLVAADTVQLPPVLHREWTNRPSESRNLLFCTLLLKKALQLLQVLAP
jgi:hypothetical protein